MVEGGLPLPECEWEWTGWARVTWSAVRGLALLPALGRSGEVACEATCSHPRGSQ